MLPRVFDFGFSSLKVNAAAAQVRKRRVMIFVF